MVDWVEDQSDGPRAFTARTPTEYVCPLVNPEIREVFWELTRVVVNIPIVVLEVVILFNIYSYRDIALPLLYGVENATSIAVSCDTTLYNTGISGVVNTSVGFDVATVADCPTGLTVRMRIIYTLPFDIWVVGRSYEYLDTPAIFEIPVFP
jgi:hypothetical protein